MNTNLSQIPTIAVTVYLNCLLYLESTCEHGIQKRYPGRNSTAAQALELAAEMGEQILSVTDEETQGAAEMVAMWACAQDPQRSGALFAFQDFMTWDSKSRVCMPETAEAAEVMATIYADFKKSMRHSALKSYSRHIGSQGDKIEVEIRAMIGAYYSPKWDRATYYAVTDKGDCVRWSGPVCIIPVPFVLKGKVSGHDFYRNEIPITKISHVSVHRKETTMIDVDSQLIGDSWRVG